MAVKSPHRSDSENRSSPVLAPAHRGAHPELLCQQAHLHHGLCPACDLRRNWLCPS